MCLRVRVRYYASVLVCVCQQNAKECDECAGTGEINAAASYPREFTRTSCIVATNSGYKKGELLANAAKFFVQCFRLAVSF